MFSLKVTLFFVLVLTFVLAIYANGCYLTSDFVTNEIQTGLAHLTQETCESDCNQYGTKYAGVSDGDVCRCGQLKSGANKADNSKCNVACSGDSSENCGGSGFTRALEL